MGYILPIRPYQSYEYQRRMRISKQDPMHIDKSFPVILASQYDDIAKEYTAPADNFIDMNEKTEKRVARSENIYARLTGKGKKFNDSI